MRLQGPIAQKKGSLMKNLIISTIFVSFLGLMGSAPVSADDTLTYDTAWTFVYDGGKFTTGLKTAVTDKFYDVKALQDGGYACVGQSSLVDSNSGGDLFLLKLSAEGEMLWKKLYRNAMDGGCAHSIAISKNESFLVGGNRGAAPYLISTDSIGNLKWSTWYYDSTKDENKLSRGVTINCLRESTRGTIVCAAGDVYPDNGGLPFKNYAAFLEFDSTGKYIRSREWDAVAGYNMGGFDIEETDGGKYLLSGNQAVLYLDSVGKPDWQATFSYQLTGVGSEVANICRAKVLRGNNPMVAGQVYEGNCWTYYQKLYYDAWWSPISYIDGSYKTWDTAGAEQGDDILYDFTQLNSGNLVFVGSKGYQNILGGLYTGVWVFVTDSSGKKMLWESLVQGPLDGCQPLSVCATSDSGFITVGRIGHNAFAARFVPKIVTVVSKPLVSPEKPKLIRGAVIGTKVVFTGFKAGASPVALAVYNAAGKTVANSIKLKILNGSIAWDCSNVAKGVYYYSMHFKGGVARGKVSIN
jgi:hypothetical protein